MPRVPSRTGWKWETKNHWFFISFGGHYTFHIALGRFAISYEKKFK